MEQIRISEADLEQELADYLEPESIEISSTVKHESKKQLSAITPILRVKRKYKKQNNLYTCIGNLSTHRIIQGLAKEEKYYLIPIHLTYRKQPFQFINSDLDIGFNVESIKHDWKLFCLRLQRELKYKIIYRAAISQGHKKRGKSRIHLHAVLILPTNYIDFNRLIEIWPHGAIRVSETISALDNGFWSMRLDYIYCKNQIIGKPLSSRETKSNIGTYY